MNILIEKLQLKDLDDFWEVFSQTIRTDFPGYSPKVIDYFLTQMYSKYNFQQWLMTGWKIVLVVRAAKPKAEQVHFGAGIVGFAVLDRPYGGVCFCRWLGVLKDYRNKGIGRKLIEEAINYTQNYGGHKIELASQPEAKGFYHKAGLELEGKRKLSYFGIDQYIFGKVIGRPKDEVMIRD